MKRNLFFACWIIGGMAAASTEARPVIASCGMNDEYQCVSVDNPNHPVRKLCD